MRIDPVSILRGLARNWWKILGLWLAAAAPVIYLIYTQVKPTYQAYSTIQVNTILPAIFDTDRRNTESWIDRNIETEIGRITLDPVLIEAVADPLVVDLPIVKNSPWPIVTIRNKLAVHNIPKTELIRVSLDSTDPVEAANVVNAVVRAYLKANELKASSADGQFKKSLTDYLEAQQADRLAKQSELLALTDQGNINPENLAINKPSQTSGNAPAANSERSDASSFSFEMFRKYQGLLLEVQVQLFETKAELDQRLAGFEEIADTVEDPDATSRSSKEELDQLVAAEFHRQPAVMELVKQQTALENQVDHIGKGTRKFGDPALLRAQQALTDVTDRLNATWRSQHKEIENRVKLAFQQGIRTTTEDGQAEEGRPRTIPELRAKVAELERRRQAIVDGLDETKFEVKTSNSHTFRAQFLQAQIQTISQNEQVVSRKIQDLDIRNNQSTSKVEMLHEAVVPSTPSDSKRLKLMAAAPAALLIALLGLFSLFEIKAERVGDPDSLSSRVQSEVYSLPPIPMSRSPRRLGTNGDDNIDRFIQRLDHLRFAICGDHPDVGLGRCVLISSAVGGEGKTTLAAQLAARCGHAGHSTLLIDADLRRGALCPLLDVPEGLGLNDVLSRDELNVEDVVIPVQGGTFHLLCAGTPTSDTSRVFQGRSFGMLIARLRQLYDLIIIDSPPILPVPDALIMGRWTDGVVLASRYDVSRAPQVERARRQLDLAGIPVLGTVINGMRTSDSYYGRYTYSRQSSTASDQGDLGDEPSNG